VSTTATAAPAVFAAPVFVVTVALAAPADASAAVLLALQGLLYAALGLDPGAVPGTVAFAAPAGWAFTFFVPQAPARRLGAGSAGAGTGARTAAQLDAALAALLTDGGFVAALAASGLAGALGFASPAALLAAFSAAPLAVLAPPAPAAAGAAAGAGFGGAATAGVSVGAVALLAAAAGAAWLWRRGAGTCRPWATQAPPPASARGADGAAGVAGALSARADGIVVDGGVDNPIALNVPVVELNPKIYEEVRREGRGALRGRWDPLAALPTCSQPPRPQSDD